MYFDKQTTIIMRLSTFLWPPLTRHYLISDENAWALTPLPGRSLTVILFVCGPTSHGSPVRALTNRQTHRCTHRHSGPILYPRLLTLYSCAVVMKGNGRLLSLNMAFQEMGEVHKSLMHSKKFFFKHPLEYWVTGLFSFYCVSCRVSNP